MTKTKTKAKESKILGANNSREISFVGCSYHLKMSTFSDTKPSAFNKEVNK